MEALSTTNFDRNYPLFLQHLKLKGLQPKTIEAYSRAIRRIGERFDYQIDRLSEQQLTDYFRAAVIALLEHGQAGSVWLEVLLRACPADTLGRARFDQASENPALAGHCHGRGGQAAIHRHPHAQ